MPNSIVVSRGCPHVCDFCYKEANRWGSIIRGAAAHGEVVSGLRHFAYAAGWKKFEPLWDAVIRAKRAGLMLPVLETILSEFGRRPASETVARETTAVVPYGHETA